MRKKIKLKDKETGDILNLDTPICFVANGHSWEFDSIKELMDACEDVPEKEVWYLGKRIGNYSMPKKEADMVTEKILAWKRLKDKGFRFKMWEYDDKYATEMPCILIRATKVNGYEYDLDLLFGGEDEAQK